MTTNSCSSYDVASWRDVDIGNVDVAAAVGRDNGAIRYGSWRFVFADYATEDGSEGSGCSEPLLVCRHCCCWTKRALETAIEQRIEHYRRSFDKSIDSQHYCSCNWPWLSFLYDTNLHNFVCKKRFVIKYLFFSGKNFEGESSWKHFLFVFFEVGNTFVLVYCTLDIAFFF